MNDFELVDAIRTLALIETNKVNDKICGDSELERIFQRSLRAKDVLHSYTQTVTEYNYFGTARTFLKDEENDDFCKAVERIEKDIHFINSNMRVIVLQKDFFVKVKSEMEFVDIDMQEFDTIYEQYMLLLETDPVNNYSAILAQCQKVKDLYYNHMKQLAGQMSNGYCELLSKLQAVRAEADKYPQGWNNTLYKKIDEKELVCKKYITTRIELKDYQIRCSLCHLQLRDIDSAIKMLPQMEVDIDVMTTEVNIADPNPQQVPNPQQGTPQPMPQPKTQPKERKLRNQLPTGKLSVAEYKQWLKQQLAMVNQFDSADILKFDE
jgi:hypothetical protein